MYSPGIKQSSKFTSNLDIENTLQISFDKDDIREDIEEANGQPKASPFKSKSGKYDVDGSGISIPEGNVDELLDWAQNLPDKDEFK